MNEAPRSNRLILTTETLSNLRDRVFVLLFFGGLAAAVTLLMYVERDKPIDDEAVLACAFLQMMLLGTGVVCGGFAPPRGTWILDDDAVTFCPCHRRSRALRWSSVDRLNWRNDYAILKGGKVKILIPWEMFKETERLPGRAFAEARLSSGFDLKDVAWPDKRLFRKERSLLAKLAKLARLAAIGVGLSAPWLALVVIAFWVPAGSWGWFLTLLFGVMLITIVGPQLYWFLIISSGDLRRLRQIHPEWPWRLRRTKAGQLTKVGAAADPWLDDL